jgi:hypothetical protein
MEPRDVATDNCCGEPGTGSHEERVSRPVRADGCCGAQAAGTSFEQRVDLGRRRQVLVRRVALIASVVMLAAALVLMLAGHAPVLAGRLAWGAAIWEVILVPGWVRAVLSARQVDWRLVVTLAEVSGGLAWQPLVAALVAVALLAERVLRSPRPETATGDTGVGSAAVGQPG